jgi:hypothetical protein
MIGLALALLLQTSAQTPPQPRPADITVTARKEKRRISGLINSIITAADGNQLSRFEAAICPGVIGGRPEFTDTVLRLVRRNIEDVGAKLQPEGCKASALVILTPDPRDLMNALTTRRRSLTRTFDRLRRDRLLHGNDAIRSWQMVARQSARGAPIDADFMAPPVSRQILASRIVAATRLDAYFAIAILDINQVAGKTVQQLADIATMHLLLNITPGGAEMANDSILSLFVHDPAPPSMTAFDRGMLKGLYGSEQNAVPGFYKRGQMAVAIRREREQEAEEATP